jgi:hypothetical protein
MGMLDVGLGVLATSKTSPGWKVFGVFTVEIYIKDIYDILSIELFSFSDFSAYYHNHINMPS